MKEKNKNTGLVEEQIKGVTARIKKINTHMNENKHDYVTKLSLTKIINKRRKMLKYLKNSSPERYNKVISAKKQSL